MTFIPEHSDVWNAFKSSNQWINYVLPSKIPINPNTLYNAKTNDPATWSNYDIAFHNIGKVCLGGSNQDDKCIVGIGLVPINGLCGIDLDHVLDQGTNRLTPFAERLLKKLNSYAEISPSGDGVHIWIHINDLQESINFKKHVDDQGSYLKNGAYVFETYAMKGSSKSGHYLTLTGNPLPNYNKPVATVAADLILSEIERVKAEESGSVNKALSQMPDHTSNASVNPVVSLSDQEVISKMLTSKNGSKIQKLYEGNIEGYGSQSEADIALCIELCFWCHDDRDQVDRIFRTSKLYRDKWDRKTGDKTYGDLTIDKALDIPHDVYEPKAQANIASVKTSVFDKNGKVTFNNFEPFQNTENIDACFNKKTSIAFPVECLPYWIADYAKEVAKSIQIDVAIPAIAMLGVYSMCLNGECEIYASEDYHKNANLYLLTFANSGEGKSPATSKAIEPLDNEENQFNKEHKKEIKFWERKVSGLTKRIEKLNQKAPIDEADFEKNFNAVQSAQAELDELLEHPLKEMNIYANDGTPEGLALATAEEGGIYSVFSDEGSFFDKLTGLYTNGTPNFGVVLKGDNGGNSKEVLVSGNRFTKNANLVMCITGQPSRLFDMLKKKSVLSQGLLQRFLISIPYTTAGDKVYSKSNLEIDSHIKEQYAYYIKEALHLYKEPICLGKTISKKLVWLDDDSLELWTNWRNTKEKKMKKDAYYHGNSAFSKLSDTCLKIALILYIGDGGTSGKVSKDIMERAITISNYFLKMDEIIYSNSSNGEMDSQYIWKKIVNKVNSVNSGVSIEIKKRDVIRSIGIGEDRRFKSVEEMNPLFQELIDRGYVRIEKSKGKAEMIFVNSVALNYEKKKLINENQHGDDKGIIT